MSFAEILHIPPDRIKTALTVDQLHNAVSEFEQLRAKAEAQG